MKKIAVITGCNGQDGSYLSELLLAKDYRVVGIVRRSSVNTLWRLADALKNPDFTLCEGDITDINSLLNIFDKYKPHEVYNLAAQSHVGTSFDQPVLTWRVNAEGVLNVLEAVRRTCPQTRLYQASTSEMFGGITREPQNEETRFCPQSPYAAAKLAAHNLCNVYRKSYDLFISCGILMNHESPRRGENFVTRKVTKYIADLVGNKTKTKLCLGNLNACRDWGYAPTYVKGMWAMLQQATPADYVLATGKTYSVRDFVREAFAVLRLNYTDYVEISPDLYRPAEVEYLCGDFAKAKRELGWTPEIDFKELVKILVMEELHLSRNS